MSKDTSSETPGPATPETKPDFVRPLPKVKSVQESLKKGLVPTVSPDGDPQTPEEARAKLRKFNDEIQKRLADVSDMLADLPDEVKPTKDPEFNSFVRSQLAYANMFYVVFGRFPPDAEGDPTSKNPFLDDAANAANDIEMPPGIDPALANHPAARAAVARGIDLIGGDEDI